MARAAALGAVLIGIALVGLLLFTGGEKYTVNAQFLNAGQLVNGNVVDIGGADAGLVEDRRLTPDGRVEVELSIDDKYAPLRRGTKAVIRTVGQTSTAGRYVQLMLPPENEAGGEIEDGGVLSTNETTTNVEIDQFFNMLDRRTRRAVQNFYRGGYRQWRGRGAAGNRGFRYLSPQLNASTRLFEELRYEPGALEGFLRDSSRFVTALSERRTDLSALIENLNRTTRALGSDKQALAEVVQRFPPFMRQANTTYVNLRATLDELDPWVEASKPVARRLRTYLGELRPFARDAVPTVRNLRRVVRNPRAPGDLLRLNRTYPPLAEIALDTRRRRMDYGTGAIDVGRRPGAFPEVSRALRRSAPIVAHGRPYTPDLIGWFDDFSHTGAYDALGSFSRSQIYFNQFTVNDQGLPEKLIAENCGALPPPLNSLPCAGISRETAFRRLANLHQNKRCPGGAEVVASDRSNVWSEEAQRELDCVEAHRATGNR